MWCDKVTQAAPMVQITDTLTVDASGLVKTKDGYLVGDARVARAGNVQQYYGYEIGLTGDDANRVIGVYRDPDTVFDEAAMLSLAGRPVTRNHPPAGVDATTWKDLAKGQMGQVIRRDGEHVVAPMAIMDAEAVAEVESGARSLSAGYTVGIVADAGVAPDGTPYEYRQAGPLRFNHVAYLPDNNPRAGNTRIGDAQVCWGSSLGDGALKQPTGGRDMTDKLQAVVVDGISIQTTDQGAQAIAKLQKALADADAVKAKADADHEAEIAAKDSEIAKKDAEIDALKGKVLDDAALDARVQARADLIAKAKAIVADVKTDGLGDAEIRKAVVKAKLGDAAIAGKSEAYVEARFDLLAEDMASTGALASAIAGVKAVNTNDAEATEDAAHKAYLARFDRKKSA